MAGRSTAFVRAIAAQIPWLEEYTSPDAALSACCRACEAALECRAIVHAIGADTELRGVLADQFAGIDTKIDEVLETLAFGQNLQNYPLPDQVVSKLRAGHPVEVAQRISAVLTQVLEGLQNVRRFEADLAGFGALDLNSWLGANADGDLRSFATALMERAEASADNVDELVPWFLYCKFRSFRQAISVQTGRRFRWKPTGRFGPKRHPVADGFWSRLWRTAAA